MRRIAWQMLAAGLLLVSGFSARAWSAAGHMVVAAEAYRELTPELKAKVNEILKSHPDYLRWEKSYRQGTNLDLATYVFLKASIWPDEIRRTEGANAEYDHAHWHYIDYPLKPPGFALESDAAPEDNVVFGIGECEKALLDAKTAPKLRAAQLSYLIHLVGDIHQPLHAATLINATYPEGDKGGNNFYVRPRDKGVRLHSVWDGLLGTAYHFTDEINYAIKLQAEFPRKSLPELAKAKTAKDWALESRQIAIDVVYQKGELKGSKEADTAPPLPAGYTQAAKVVAEKRGVLAGYRLADEIQKCVK